MSATSESALLQAARSGDALAQTDLGIFYFSRQQYAQALPWLQKAAEQAAPQACNLLGLMHLNGIAVPQRPELAVGYLEQAAAQNLKEACYTLANLLFNGIGTATDERRAWALLLRAANSRHWPALRTLGMLHFLAGARDEALRCLRLSARGGDALAQYQLARPLLQSEVLVEQSEGVFWLRQAADRRVPCAIVRLRQLAGEDGGRRLQSLLHGAPPKDIDGAAVDELSVPDLGKFRETLPAEELSTGVLYQMRKVLPPFLCEHFINVATPSLMPSTVADPVTGKILANDVRTSSSMSFQLSMYDFIAGVVLKRFAQLVDRSPTHAEPFALLCYQVGQQYKPHRDYFTSQGNRDELVDGRGGQRDVTIFVYLNDVEAGGETDFPLLGACVSPEQGKAVKFLNLTAQGEPNADTLHAGKPVLRGEKWLLTVWFRQRPFVWGELPKR